MVVTNVYSGSPAESAGLRNYDVVLDANGTSLDSDTSLQSIISKLKVGDRLVLRVDRGGNIKLIAITIQEMPSNFGATIATTAAARTMATARARDRIMATVAAA